MSKNEASSSPQGEVSLVDLLDGLESTAMGIESDLQEFLGKAEASKKEDLADRLDEARDAAHRLISCIRDAAIAAAAAQ